MLYKESRAVYTSGKPIYSALHYGNNISTLNSILLTLSRILHYSTSKMKSAPLPTASYQKQIAFPHYRTTSAPLNSRASVDFIYFRRGRILYILFWYDCVILLRL